MNMNKKLEDYFSFKIYASSRAIIKSYREELSKYNLTYPQYLVLIILWEEKKVSIKRICERLYLDTGTLTPLLKRMVINGYIKKKRSEKDERVIEVTLTKQGRNLETKIKDLSEEMTCESEFDFKGVSDLMDKIIKCKRLNNKGMIL